MVYMSKDFFFLSICEIFDAKLVKAVITYNSCNPRSLHLGLQSLEQEPCLDGILPSSVSNLLGDYHNSSPAKLVHTRKTNHRRLVICWKTLG